MAAKTSTLLKPGIKIPGTGFWKRLSTVSGVAGTAQPPGQLHSWPTVEHDDDPAAQLLRSIVLIRDQETDRIARVLHGESGQLLAAVHLALEAIAHENQGIPRNRLDQIHDLLDQITAQLRELSHELYPRALGSLGLETALKHLAEGFSKRNRIPVNVNISIPNTFPSAEVQTNLYRIVQETLNNVARHACANSVDIRLSRQGEWLLCSVSDDGRGFDVHAVMGTCGDRLGLVDIHQRVALLQGELALDSVPGAGSRIRIRIPLDAAQQGISSAPRGGNVLKMVAG
jgi:signal transduction histidine kinase